MLVLTLQDWSLPRACLPLDEQLNPQNSPLFRIRCLDPVFISSMLSVLESLPATYVVGIVGMAQASRPQEAISLDMVQEATSCHGSESQTRERHGREPVFTEPQAQDMGVVLVRTTQD